jgi:putative RNA 2'-phosphotransferase
MSKKQLGHSRKFLSLILRHAPETIGIQLDNNGWVSISALLEQAAKHDHSINRAELDEIVATSDKKRFAVSDDGLSIRANQGHSIASIDLALPPETPPTILYHGTASRFINSIKADGLRAGSRNHVHLSLNQGTATAVGSRHGKPVILQIRAQAMQQHGHLFYISDNGVWLTAAVPVDFIDFPAAV